VTAPAPASRRLHLAAAILFGIVTVSYAALWTFYAQGSRTAAYLGVFVVYDGWTQTMRISEVVANGPAAQAGLREGDLIVAVNGRPLNDPFPFYDQVSQGRPGQRVQFDVSREGGPPRAVEAVLARHDLEPPDSSLLRRLVFWPLRAYPVPFVIVALGVLLLRGYDRNAWLVAVSFAGLGVAPLEPIVAYAPRLLRRLIIVYSYTANGFAPACFYWLLATFPAPSPLHRRLPWLKAVLLGLSAALWIPISLVTLVAGSLWPFVRWLTLPGAEALNLVQLVSYYTAVGFAGVSLLLNCRRSAAPDGGRRARFMAWSFAVGLIGWAALVTAQLLLRRDLFNLPFWFWVPCALLMMAAPVLFGYAVVRHRVLEFSLFVRRGARYVLVQRGFLLLALALSLAVTWLFVAVIAQVLPRLTDAALPTGIAAGAAFGLLLVRTGGAVAGRVARRIDQAFFRSAYDARLVLEELAQQSALVTNRAVLAGLLEGQLVEALHPRTIAVYLRDEAGRLARASSTVAGTPPALDDADPLLERLQDQGLSHEVTPAEQSHALVSALDADCLVPMQSRRGRLIGLLALGTRRSEEPYSREDKRLLASVSRQAGGALENLMLAEEMAVRIEVERRAAHEMQVAAEVQRRLFPARPVVVDTIEYAARCVQARQVGGDYYDVLDLGNRQVGFALADVSGKGLYASLLMAHLQASLRSLSEGIGTADLPRLLEVVNRSFCASTAGNHFATLFLARYDDGTRRLTYANCGHQPPAVLRADGSVERLAVTARAIGLFDPLEAAAAEVDLRPGDLLAIFSDGVTEAMSPDGQEFGESRLIEALGREKDRPVAEAVEHVIADVRAFSGAEQSDDVTLMVLRAR